MNQSKKQIGLVVTFVDVTELRTSERMFKTLANSVPQMIWSTDNKGNYIYFSDQWLDFSGLDPLTIKNKGFRETIHPDDLDQAMQSWIDAQEKQDYFTYEYRLKDKFGVYHWHLLKARSLKDATGKIFRWFGTCTNIQKQKELEIDLRTSQMELLRNQERFNNVAHAVEIGVWYCNLPFDVLNWSETVKKHFWCEDFDEITIEIFYERLHPEDRERTRQAIETSIVNHEPYDINYRTVNPQNGKFKWIRAVGWTDYDENDTPIRFDGVTLDITNDMLYLDKLKESEWRYSMASKAARELIWDWNLVTNEVDWNESLVSEFGYPRENIHSTGEWWIDHIHPDERERVAQGIHHAIDNKEAHWNDEYHFLKHDGTYAHVVDRGYIQFDDKGNPVRMIGTMNDNTEKNLYLAQMKDAIRARDEFLSIASHELKTPLTSMVLQMQMLKRKIERGQVDDAAIHKANQLTLKQCGLLTSLIDDMLDVSRIANGKMAFSFQKVSLGEVVASSLEAFSANIQEKNIDVDFKVEQGFDVKGDPFRLEQVVYNLLSNTLKYGDGKPISVKVYPQENFGVIEVKDQGLGINAEHLDKIFHLFERAIPSTSISGLGLGLYISKQIVDAHEGYIEVESQLKQGSTFKVFIPKL